MQLQRNQNRAFGALPATLFVAILLLGILAVYSSVHADNGRSTMILYYDLGEGQIKLVEYSAGDILTTPLEGTQTYQVSVFSCTECKEITDGMTPEDLAENGMFAAYVYRLPEEEEDNPDIILSSEIRLVDGPDTWVNADSERGAELVRQALGRCDDGARACSQKPRKQ